MIYFHVKRTFNRFSYNIWKYFIDLSLRMLIAFTIRENRRFQNYTKMKIPTLKGEQSRKFTELSLKT